MEIIRRGTNLVLRSVPDKVVLRVSESRGYAEILENLNFVISASESSQVLPPSCTEVIESQGYVATAWPLGKPRNDPAAFREFGAALRSFHDLEFSADLTRLDLKSSIQKRLKILTECGVSNGDISVLDDLASAVYAAHDLMVVSGDTVLHGDAYIGNVVEYSGELFLIDLDDVCIGPWQYDLIPTAVTAYRFAQQHEYELLLDGYGNAIEDWKFLDHALRIRELTMTTWLGTLYSQGETVQREFALRMETLKNGMAKPLWGSV